MVPWEFPDHRLIVPAGIRSFIERIGDDVIGYAPYPQQQYPQPGYPQQYPQYQQPYPYVQPPPKSDGKSKLVIIIIVIIVVLVILIPIIMSAYLIFYMQSFSSGPGTQVQIVSMNDASFINPYDGNGTTNGGGWRITIIASSGPKTSLANVRLKVGNNGIWAYTMSGVTSSGPGTSYQGSFDWYLDTAGSAAPIFMDGISPKTLSSSTTKDLSAGEFETVQGAAFVYIDGDADGFLGTGDTIFIYSDTDADKNPEITPGDTFQIGDATSLYGSLELL